MVVALAALFIWASVGQAQTEQQTYEPAGEQVSAVSTSAGGGASGTGGATATASAGDGEASGTDSLSISLLPTTGGPLLPLIGLGAIALGATGLLARHRYSRR